MVEVQKPPRWGRPPLEKGCVRSERIVTFLTPAERDTLVRCAEDLGQSVSATAHQLICDALKDEFGDGHLEGRRSKK